MPLLALLIFAIVFGIRYNVGIDHLTYLNYYELLRLTGKEMDCEIGFVWLSEIFANLNLHFSIYFTFIAFLQIYLLFYALKEEYRLHLFVIITFMLSTTFLNFMNGIRQEIAFCFWAVAIRFLAKRNFVFCYLMIFFAIMFHSSALLLLPIPFFFIKQKKYFDNVFIQIALLFLALIILFVFQPAILIFAQLGDLMDLLGYSGYKNMALGGNLAFLEPQRERGIGFLVLLLLNLLFVCLSRNVKRYFRMPFLNIIYDLYFVGMLYAYLVSGSLILQRINYYFYNFGFIIGAFTLYYLISNRTLINQLLFILILLFYLLQFCAVIVLRGVDSCAIYHVFCK